MISSGEGMTSSSRTNAFDDGVPDTELVAAVQAGSLAAFEALVARHERPLINYFYHVAWDRQIAEDCAQEVFLRLHAHLGRYEAKAKFTTFLYRIARNLWIDRLRVSHGVWVSLDAGSEESSGRPLRDRISSRGDSPVETMEREETRQRMRRAIESLPEDQRVVVILSELQGMRYQEISVVLEVPVGTVKSRMFVAMQRLKELLTHEM